MAVTVALAVSRLSLTVASVAAARSAAPPPPVTVEPASPPAAADAAERVPPPLDRAPQAQARDDWVSRAELRSVTWMLVVATLVFVATTAMVLTRG